VWDELFLHDVSGTAVFFVEPLAALFHSCFTDYNQSFFLVKTALFVVIVAFFVSTLGFLF
jgi:hypothetical protein